MGLGTKREVFNSLPVEERTLLVLGLLLLAVLAFGGAYLWMSRKMR